MRACTRVIHARRPRAVASAALCEVPRLAISASPQSRLLAILAVARRDLSSRDTMSDTKLVLFFTYRARPEAAGAAPAPEE